MKPAPQCSFRIPLELKEKAESVMQRRGIIKLSDFIRQAIVAEIQATERRSEMATSRPAENHEKAAS